MMSIILGHFLDVSLENRLIEYNFVGNLRVVPVLRFLMMNDLRPLFKCIEWCAYTTFLLKLIWILIELFCHGYFHPDILRHWYLFIELLADRLLGLIVCLIVGGVIFVHFQVVFYMVACRSLSIDFVCGLDKFWLRPPLLLDVKGVFDGWLNCLLRRDLAVDIVHGDRLSQLAGVVDNRILLPVDLVILNGGRA